LDYWEETVSDEYVGRISRDFVRILGEMVARPEGRLGVNF
jgi:hypothetical protein